MTQAVSASPADGWPDARGAIRVGEWHVAGDLNEITRGGESVRLEPKAMAVLLYLAQRPGAVVSRDELLGAIWPGVVVGDNVLTQAVIKLRKALGDTAREPSYVQSIAKRGYRLIAEVRRGDSPNGEEDGRRPAIHADRRAMRRRAVPVLLSVILMVAAAAWFVRLAPDTGRPATADPPAESAHVPPTVLVEPFDVLGAAADPAQAAWARGLSSDLMTDLSKVSSLSVLSPIDPARRRPGMPPPARYVLSGTVQQEGERLRLNVLLTDTDSGRPLWSERFDHRVRELFDVQDELVHRVLDILPVKVGEAETRRLAQRSTRDLEAYRLFNLAQAALLARRPAENESAKSLYWDAIRRDPAFARAYAGLGMAWALEYQLGWAAQDGEAALAHAAEYARTSLRMRPDMPEARWVLAFVAAQRRQHAEALDELDQALRLNPSFADAYALKGGIYTYIGQPAQSLAMLQTAFKLNPDAGSLYFLLLGRACYFLDDFEQARFHLGRALERNPDNVEARIYLGAAQWRQGDRDAALWQVSEIRQLEPAFSADRWLATYPLADAAAQQRLRTAMIELGLGGGR